MHPECPDCETTGLRSDASGPETSSSAETNFCAETRECETCAGYGWVMCAPCRAWSDAYMLHLDVRAALPQAERDRLILAEVAGRGDN